MAKIIFSQDDEVIVFEGSEDYVIGLGRAFSAYEEDLSEADKVLYKNELLQIPKAMSYSIIIND